VAKTELGPQPPIHPVLTDAEYKAKLAELEASRQNLVKVMRGVKKDLIAQGLTTKTAVVHKGWDIHCFFPRHDHPNSIIHFQIYIMSVGIEYIPTGDVRFREMDRKKMLAARKSVSIGIEETAVTREIPGGDRRRMLLSQPAISSLLEQVLRP
jgi:hypothetical protein